MLAAIERSGVSRPAWERLPRIIDQFEPIGPLSRRRWRRKSAWIPRKAPLVFPTSDDQQAGLVGGGAVDAGQVAIILGTSAVVNSSSTELPATDDLD